ncbi:MAG: MFS transporter [Actinomycetota bacterium]
MSRESIPKPHSRARTAVRNLAVDRTPFRASPHFKRMWWGEFVSQIGTQITVVSIFYQVQVLTGSTAKVGLVGLIQVVPLMLSSLLGRPLIDRMDRRKILLVTSVLFVGATGTLLFGATLHRTPLWLIYLAAAASAALSGISAPTRGAIVPNLIPREMLSSAVALNQVMFNAAMIVGPAIGGLIIQRFGLRWAYTADAISFLALIYVAIRLPPQRAHGDARAPAGFGAVRESLQFVRGSRVLQGTFVADLIAMIFGMPRALFPILVVQRFHRGPELIGVLFSAVAVGGVVGALTTGWVRRVKRQGYAVLVAVSIWGGAIAAFGFTRIIWVALVCLAVAGTADVISAVFRGTILQTVVTDAVRGRLSAIHILVVTGGPRLGDLEAGIVASVFSPLVSVVSGGVACVAGVLLMGALMPEFAAYRAPDHRVDASGVPS